MAQTRTPKGTAQIKTSSTTFTGPSVSINAGETLIIGIMYASETVHPSKVKFGKRNMRFIDGSRITNANATVAQYRVTSKRNMTKTPVFTWPSAIAAKAMICTVLTETSKKDVQKKKATDAAVSPGTGVAETTTVTSTIHIAFFGSKGPVTDAAGTPGAGHTSGQRVGTTGAPPASNVTLHETYEILTATGNCRATLLNATSRDWAANIVAYKRSQQYTIIGAVEQRGIADPDFYHVKFLVETELSGEVFEIRINPDEFDDMTDQQVTERIIRDCVWHQKHHVEDDGLPVPDSDRTTRAETFIDDQIDV